jgi:hypothetical protein
MTPQRITHAHTRRLAARLTPRDYLILATLPRVRVATSRQLERLWFTDATPLSNARMARRTLRRLVDLRVLTRVERPSGGLHGGSLGNVFTLDVAGLRMADRGAGRRSPRRPHPVSRTFLDHALGVTEWYVRLAEAERTGGPKLLEFKAEPGSWRQFASYAGGQETLKPDAFVSLLSGEWEDRFFLEVDRGTEHSPALRRQLDRYERYWRSGREQAASEVFPQVLWIVPDSARHAVLVELIGRLPAEVWPVFRVATEDDALGVLTGGTP